MVKVHKLVKCEEQQGNFPQYRWYAECSCGFQARLATKVAVEDQFKHHLEYHGVTVEAPVEEVGLAEVAEPPSEPVVDTTDTDSDVITSDVKPSGLSRIGGGQVKS